MAEERKTLEQRHQMSDLERLRHSAAHVLATAIAKLWPDAQFAAGPPVETGFYYDVDLKHRISPEDFQKIEEEMKKEIKANNVFEKIVVTRELAIKDSESGRLGGLSERPANPSKFKIGNLEAIPEGEPISYFKNGDFIDLCAGPHVMRTGNIGAFKLTTVASAYYKGDERNPQLQRIYGTAFKNKTALDEYFKMLEEAKRRDHRKIGAEMGLFAIDTEFVGPGMPLWLPKGTVLVEELEKLAKETEFAAGYVRVRTPHLAREKMYLTSGHLPYYAESMFPPMTLLEGADAAKRPILREKMQEALHDSGEITSEKIDAFIEKAQAIFKAEELPGERYYLKAMNCPHHHRIFAAEPHSYRDLPLRLAEYGTCYRYEQSGELFGLMRVRCLHMNDAHIYCTKEQFYDEFKAVNDMYLKYFKIFGIDKYVMRLSLHNPAKLGQKYVDEPELWKETEALVRDVLVRTNTPFVEVQDEAAFYGPKIDVQIWSTIGREFTLATNQVDFAQGRRFKLEFTNQDNKPETPLIIHRAPLGTHERFIGFLLEHYAGKFPVWLAPVQVKVLPISDKFLDYAKSVADKLKKSDIRAEVDDRNEKIGKKIRDTELMKVPYMLVVGEKEMNENKVAVRRQGKGDLGVKGVDDFVNEIVVEFEERKAE